LSSDVNRTLLVIGYGSLLSGYGMLAHRRGGGSKLVARDAFPVMLHNAHRGLAKPSSHGSYLAMDLEPTEPNLPIVADAAGEDADGIGALGLVFDRQWAERLARRRGVHLVPVGVERSRVAARLARAAGLPAAVACAGAAPMRELRWTPLVLPALLPFGAAVMIAVFVLNVSRIFLAAGSTGSIVLGVALIVLTLGGAAGISAAPRLRTSPIVMMVSGVFLVVISAGLVAAPASVEQKAGPSGYVPPKGPAVGTVEVDALGSLTFDKKAYTAPAGIVQINYVSKDGPHNLSFDPPGPQINLNVGANATLSQKVLLKAGTTYVIYCNLPGHRAAGMEATLTAH